jgi:hypothetical protein
MQVLLGGRDVLVAHQVSDADQVACRAPLSPSTMAEVVDAEPAGAVRADARGTCRLPEHVPTIKLGEDRPVAGEPRVDRFPRAVGYRNVATKSGFVVFASEPAA